MPAAPSPPTTQRAYPLRLSGHPSSDVPWRAALWETHVTVNRGVAAWVDHLLTLRASAHPDRATPAASSTDPDQVAAERIWRRRLLALTWLTVEDAAGAPSAHRCADPLAALERHLADAGVDQDLIASWREDCAPSLTAAIREEAVWVDRRAAWRALQADLDITPDDVDAVLLPFIGSWDTLLASADGDGGGDADGKDFVQHARAWLSTHWGSGRKTDAGARLRALQACADLDPAALIQQGPDQRRVTVAAALGTPAVAQQAPGPRSRPGCAAGDHPGGTPDDSRSGGRWRRG